MMVRLNYVLFVVCWWLGNDVVVSEVSMEDGNRYVNVRFLVLVENNIEYFFDFCLEVKVYLFLNILIGLLKFGDILLVFLLGLI